MKKYFLFLLLSYFTFAQNQQMNGVELQLAVNKLSVLGSVLYIAAHPDDENTALLSYFAKGKLYRTAYLSITRGEGGQNLLGSEQGTELGVIRTQELLAARKIDGAEQFFTRAIDFGFSKSSDEALQLWNKDSVLYDIVWVIRKFRPDIIITRFSPTQGGHGHHLASAILAEEAFKISGDTNYFSEQLRYVKAWKAKRLFYNVARFGGANVAVDSAKTIKIDVGEFSPLMGKSFTEIAGISRTMHKSQAMGSAQNKGSNINEFILISGEPAKNDLFENIDVSWNRIPNGKEIGKQIAELQKEFNPAFSGKSISKLLHLRKTLLRIKNDEWTKIKIKELDTIIYSLLGLSVECLANDFSYSLGDSIGIKLFALNRSLMPVKLISLSVPELNEIKNISVPLSYNTMFQTSFSFRLPSNIPFSQHYWLKNNFSKNRYSVEERTLIGEADTQPVLTATVAIAIDKESVDVSLPIQYKWIDAIDGELKRTIEIVPPVSIQLSNKNFVFANDSVKKEIIVTVKANIFPIQGKLFLQLPEGWQSFPQDQNIELAKRGDEFSARFIVSATSSAKNGTFTAIANINNSIFSTSVKRIYYAHIGHNVFLESAEGKLLRINVATKGKLVGYIMGAGDEVPKAIEQLGYSVRLLSDEDLAKGGLKEFDAIIAGVRSYNTRETLRFHHNKLMKYVENGGSYIVQYQTAVKGETDNIGPYPLTISRDRVTDENAAIQCLVTQHSLLNYPNKLADADFTGWVQERGLYFASSWSDKYEAIFSCADVGETELKGSLLYAKYGKGNYIYTGLALFRQLPAGVPGAYRLIANVISIGK